MAIVYCYNWNINFLIKFKVLLFFSIMFAISLLGLVFTQKYLLLLIKIFNLKTIKKNKSTKKYIYCNNHYYFIILLK